MRIYSLDILRALAIISVLLVHTLDFGMNLPYFFKYVLAYGWVGVDLFFVLSGFLIGFQVKKELSQFNLKSIYNFWIKRWSRTLPLYYIVFTVYFFIKPIFLNSENEINMTSYIFLVQNFFSPNEFVQSWSLCIEEQFYLIFPLIIILIKKFRFHYIWWLIPAVFSLILRAILFYSGVDSASSNSAAYNYQFPTWTHLDGISFGLMLAFSHDSWSKLQNKKHFLIAGITLLFLSLFYIGPLNLGNKIILSYFLLSGSFSLILIGLYDLKFKNQNTFIINSALWSYSIYLWNNLIAKLVLKLSIDSYIINTLLFFLITYLISFLSYKLIEENGLKLRNYLLK